MINNAIHYSGTISSQITLHLTDMLTAAAHANFGKRSDLKKLCSIALELIDNAQRYCRAGGILFDWKVEEGKLVIQLQNIASKEDAIRLKESTDIIKKMSSEEITLAFKAQLMDPEFGEKGGAGLGMLQIARKGVDNIDVNISPFDEENYACNSYVRISLS
ncbi:MAG: hypothetical protein IT223_05815 [Crocinitomicaceae bacterium]|nr:hypothetical protein [Crocinitomicaceae bacterium]